MIIDIGVGNADRIVPGGHTAACGIERMCSSGGTDIVDAGCRYGYAVIYRAGSRYYRISVMVTPAENLRMDVG